MIRHVMEHLDSIVSFIFGILVLLFVKNLLYGTTIAFLIQILALACIVISIIEFVKQLYGKENAFWKTISVLACIYSILYSLLVLSAIVSFFVVDLPILSDIAQNTGLLVILSYLEIGQGIFWAVINSLEGQ